MAVPADTFANFSCEGRDLRIGSDDHRIEGPDTLAEPTTSDSAEQIALGCSPALTY